MIQVSKNQISTVGQKKSVMSNTVISHLFFLRIKILFFRDFFCYKKRMKFLFLFWEGPTTIDLGKVGIFIF